MTETIMAVVAAANVVALVVNTALIAETRLKLDDYKFEFEAFRDFTNTLLEIEHMVEKNTRAKLALKDEAAEPDGGER